MARQKQKAKSQRNAKGKKQKMRPHRRARAGPKQMARRTRAMAGQRHPALADRAMDFGLLERFRIPVLPYRIVQDSDAAVSAVRRIRYPVALKLVSREVLHKSEHHALSLNLHDDASVMREFARLRRLVPPCAFGGILVQKYVPARLELIVGGRLDPQFGPVLLLGMGGIYTELLHDVSLRICPIDEPQAHAMIRQLRAFPILAGARGQKPVDEKSLARLLAAASRMMMAARPRELDINPLLVTPDGLYAADARVIR